MRHDNTLRTSDNESECGLAGAVRLGKTRPGTWRSITAKVAGLLLTGAVSGGSAFAESTYAEQVPAAESAETDLDAIPMFASASQPARVHIASGHRTYRASAWGLGDYLETIEGTSTHSELVSEYRTLRRRQVAANIVGVGMGGAAIGLQVSSMLADHDGPHYDADRERTKSRIGMALITVGTVSAVIIMPKRRALRGFIDRHNALESQAPLELRVGMSVDPLNESASLAIGGRY